MFIAKNRRRTPTYPRTPVLSYRRAEHRGGGRLRERAERALTGAVGEKDAGDVGGAAAGLWIRRAVDRDRITFFGDCPGLSPGYVIYTLFCVVGIVDFLGGLQRAKSATLNGPMLRNLDLLGSFDAREDIVNGLPGVRTHDAYGSF